ncbi:helix-turn-helix transcriptional regulator [Candidatus Woesearchaeota archaeon]|nr:helix-turn-helix transcriptional regulator [Candidatus Woesearchaeota archaeon]
MESFISWPHLTDRMEKTLFLEIMGDTPVLRVFDFLILNEEFDQSMTDIAEGSGVGYSTLKLFWPTLEEQGIVTHLRTVGKAKMYKLNETNPIVKKVKELYWTVTKHAVNEQVQEKMLVH